VHPEDETQCRKEPLPKHPAAQVCPSGAHTTEYTAPTD